MATRKMELVLTLVLFSVFWRGAMAQSSCTSVLISLSPCLDFIQGNTSTPSPACCSQLATVVGSQPECLCEVINNGSSLGININHTQALALPNACNVQTPPISRCNAATSPPASPTAAPGSPPGSGSKTVPSTGGNTTKLPFSLLFFLISVTSYAWTSKTI
ncbi:hypothetical protein RHMOL_Rhmol01G0360900 [Rhododendron molle]|uniref:Uncharacterized protein n=1 Tax=Rhododendron molle TaxID=49168 RepID=A0ACC0QAN2_RHOML|nr:hypothetical protein RHMOL_Rhmol01G0360900 [Rhododendron molle]